MKSCGLRAFIDKPRRWKRSVGWRRGCRRIFRRTGDTATGGSSGAANVTIEFNSPVDSINIAYGNGPGAPAAPGLQGIGIHNVYFCPPTNAVLTASKTAEVFDPSALGLYAVPGNDIVYTIEFTNEGSGPADSNSVEVIDALPPEIRFYNGDIDDAGPQINPVSFTQSASGLTFTYAKDIAY
mgnify:CR=1 FL=1